MPTRRPAWAKARLSGSPTWPPPPRTTTSSSEGMRKRYQPGAPRHHAPMVLSLDRDHPSASRRTQDRAVVVVVGHRPAGGLQSLDERVLVVGRDDKGRRPRREDRLPSRGAAMDGVVIIPDP